MDFKSLDQIIEKAKKKSLKRLIVAVAQDKEVLKAVKSAFDQNLISPVLVGNKNKIIEEAQKSEIDITGIEIIHSIDDNNSCKTAVHIIREGNGDLLMKGLVSTSHLLKIVLSKEDGLLNEKSSLLSHLAFFESSFYHKVFCVTDAALNIAPDINDKIAILKNAVKVYHHLGIACPLVAILSPVENVNPKIEATIHGAIMSQMQIRHQIEGCKIDGPLALDNAISKDAAKHKGIISDVAGNADILLAPDLNTGNVLYKSLNFLGGASSAAIVAGACVPVVLTSRADTERSKFLSIALGVAMS